MAGQFRYDNITPSSEEEKGGLSSQPTAHQAMVGWVMQRLEAIQVIQVVTVALP